ncbi:LOW QUALITY PROTEIN: hypothetical protein HZS_2046 [Henneguya salminicola]|nr:LOW QUALITY PROTEIN: hypothetical protein HZS_2046 [Henneguya salminicola]
MEFSELYSIEKIHFCENIDHALRKATQRPHVVLHIMNELKNKSANRALKSLHMYRTISKTISLPQVEYLLPNARLFNSNLCIGQTQAWLGTNNITPRYFLKAA